MGCVVLGIPLAMGLEGFTPEGPSPCRAVATAVEIEASPDRVWSALLDIPDMVPPKDWAFRAGIAYPTAIRLEAPRAGALRRCEFSTGTLLERVDVFEPGRRLHFTVLEQPALMRELSPYRIHPPHLDGRFLQAEAGEFLLEGLPGGGTRLTGTTWYTLRYAPWNYWAAWSDAYAHRVHQRVFTAVRGRVRT